MSDGIYKEIVSSSFGKYKIKGSKFISYAYPVHSEKEIKDIIENIKRIESSARHHCYAYVLGAEKSIRVFNDDGEPYSSAGKPILGQILSKDLTNILIIVNRYFGGIKLGISGLINAYRSASIDAIINADFIIKVVKDYYEVNFQYQQINDVMRIVKKSNLEIINTNFEIKCKLIFAVEKQKSNLILNAFKDKHKLKIKYLKTL